MVICECSSSNQVFHACILAYLDPDQDLTYQKNSVSESGFQKFPDLGPDPIRKYLLFFCTTNFTDLIMTYI
jgi:hypothetical protein